MAMAWQVVNPCLSGTFLAPSWVAFSNEASASFLKINSLGVEVRLSYCELSGKMPGLG